MRLVETGDEVTVRMTVSRVWESGFTADGGRTFVHHEADVTVTKRSWRAGDKFIFFGNTYEVLATHDEYVWARLPVEGSAPCTFYEHEMGRAERLP